MAGFTKTVLTTKGRNLYAKAQTGTPISFTKAKVGSGAISGGQTLENLTDLIMPVMDVAIKSISYLGDGKTRIRMRITNTDLLEGFYFRELGLCATDPDEGEILYCVSNAGAEADFIPPEGSVAFEQVIDIITQIGNANVTAIIQETEGHVLIQDFQDHRTSVVIDHPDNSVTDAKIGNRTIADTTAAAAGAATLTNLLSKLGYMIKNITGKGNWYTLPTMNMETLAGLFHAATGHKHTGGVNDAPLLTNTSLANGAAVDAAIGNRTIDQSQVPDAGTTGQLTKCLSWLANRIKAITGKTNWYDTPVTTIEALNTAMGTKVANTDSRLSDARPANGGNSDTVDGQHFAWSNNNNNPTYLWGADISGSAYLAARAGMSVYYASNAGNADTLDGYHVGSFMLDSGHSFAVNGYQRYSNGKIEQWGEATVPANTTSLITLPISYLTAHLQTFACNSTDLAVDVSQSGGAAAPNGLTQIALLNIENSARLIRWYSIGY